MSHEIYEAGEISGIPADAIAASLGCGNPTALAQLEPGETVLDLGSGGGIDVFLSAKRVGPNGKVYGLDMTDEMLALSRENQKKAGVENIEFLKGEIENIPSPDAAVDVVISNCVINLSAGDGRRCSRGGAGDAVGVRRVQPDAALVRIRDCKVIAVSKTRVLFVCTGNSCRSQMAEGLLRHLAGDRFEVASAGTHPAGLNPGAVEAMKEIGIDISHHRSKNVDEFAGQPLDWVVTVCDSARESCPVFPGAMSRLHWNFEDPAAATGSPEERWAVFRRVRDDIAKRIREFIQPIDRALS